MDNNENNALLAPFVIITGSILAATVSYWLHIMPVEAGAIGVLDALIDRVGRAPDQYRVLPYFIIGLLTDLIGTFTSSSGSDLLSTRISIITFDAAFLAASLLVLRHYFSSARSLIFITTLLILFPFLMYGGYRPISSFILLLATALTVILRDHDDSEPSSVAAYFLLLGLMCLTRADIALMFALLGLTLSMPNWLKALAIMLPLIAQYLLSEVVFPEAVYFSPVVMLLDNLSLRFFITSPLTYLWLGLGVVFFRQITAFLRACWQQYRPILLILLAYCGVLFVIARPNEYRLFLPMLPVVLWLIEDVAAGSSQRLGDQSLAVEN